MSSQEQSRPAVSDVSQPVIKTDVTVEGVTGGPALSHKPLVVGLAAFALGLGAVIFFGIRARGQAEPQLKAATDQTATPLVEVTHPKEGAPEEIVLRGTTQAFTDTPIYARTNGYLKRWYLDIGAHVKKKATCSPRLKHRNSTNNCSRRGRILKPRRPT